MSSGAVAAGLQQSLLMPVLTRMPKERVKTQVVCLAPGAVPSAVLRQNGVPVHDIALSRKNFSLGAVGELAKAAKAFKPDVIHAWGYTAQIFANSVRKKVDRKIKVVWTVGNTVPLPPRGAGMIDRQKLKYVVKATPTADRIVYASDAGGSQHRRVGFPESDTLTIPPGIDATRFKPDPAARRKIREQLHLGPESFVIGMVAPFQPEYDHMTFIKGVGELIKTNPHVAVVLAGHGVQKGNGPLMALVGGGTLAQRVQLLGEWSDLATLFNACDVVCSSALNDGARMTLVAAMLCGVPCVATGMGAQGEVIGHYGVAIEAGSPTAFVKGIQRVLQLTPEKRAAMAHGARKHALQNYVYVRSLQKYLQVYYDLIGRQSLVSQEMPTPEIDASVPVPAKVGATADSKKPLVAMAELHDPDSLEAKVAEHVELPKWRVEQEQQRAKREQEVSEKIANSQSNGDVLQVFEAQLANPQNHDRAFTEKARGVADESEELLSMEAIATPKVGAAKPAAAPAPVPVVASTPTPAPAPVVAVTPTPAPAPKPPVAAAPVPVPVPAPAAAPVVAPPAVAVVPTPVPTLTLAEEPTTIVAPGPIVAPTAEPASVTQPLAALALLEAPAEQPMQLGLLGDAPPAVAPAAPPVPEPSPQLELLADDQKRQSA